MMHRRSKGNDTSSLVDFVTQNSMEIAKVKYKAKIKSDHKVLDFDWWKKIQNGDQRKHTAQIGSTKKASPWN